MELGVINGVLYIEGRFEKNNIYVKEGKIAAITDKVIKADKVIDAKGMWVLPGLIDPHVHLHLKVGNTYSRDDFEVGSKLAAFGGVTTIIDFLKPIKTYKELVSAYNNRLEDAKGSCIDYSFHTTIADYYDGIDRLVEWTINHGMPSIKLFTTYASTNRQTKDDTIVKLLKASKEAGFRVHIHAENNGMINELNGDSVCEHENRRPYLSEVSEVIKLAQFTESTGGKCYIVHLNCGTTLEVLKEKYSKLLNNNRFIIESCPHYLLMNNEVYNTGYGYRYVMTPPLRSKNEQSKLRSLFDDIDVIGTDHCPYSEEEKRKELLDHLPNGIEGLPYTLPSLFNIWGESVLEKLTHTSAEIHGLYPKKGTLKVGSDGDLVIFDPNVNWQVGGKEPWETLLNREGKESPYYKMPMKGVIKMTFVRGKKVMDGDTVFENRGEFIRREI